ncbi:Os09g0400100 [Oryza sativa Japonica Group]|uniref:Os09g0400100 protein n=2 Tax=Oryza sativa subsp. japonica TaxID=39947 RepID=A0A0P0XMT3_ORYSJ|nr:hypothetical protein OsJ_29282 [Oryza sativa Japonica Group]KAB8110405.1 hypothetical protein EE612_047631 [Oryza sativa]BAD28501.1 unknown protein [Oryza sativa Japonica Group]BAD28602.1 unknown protein [Oryza sativa Japonica Group]BAF25025.1 Os09g0400100 [Oryza sativa Japonica Group]|eukprot:NP_001063111.1 Os09g0400100 [Oryza sativa Japonica Group]
MAWQSLMPPTQLPVMPFPPGTMAYAGSSSGLVGAPTNTICAIGFISANSGATGCHADTVLRIPSMVPAAAAIWPASRLTRNSSAPRCSSASRRFPGDVLMTVTRIPNALANLTATWPSPPRPTTPTCFPGAFSPWITIGLYTVTPAHSSGAAPSSGSPAGTRST